MFLFIFAAVTKTFNMKYVSILFAVIVVFTLCTASSLKKKDEPKVVYAFGVAASFTDTLVYYTEIQVLDSAQLSKEGFLMKRDLYSYQLKNYLVDNSLQENSTCMIYFSDKKAKLEKEAAKLLEKYKKKKNLSLILLSQEKFKFTKPIE